MGRWNNRAGKGMAALLLGLLLSAVVSTAILLLLALILWKTQMDVDQMKAGILLTYLISCFAGGLYYGKKAERRKFLRGMLLGALYFLLLLAFSFLGEDSLHTDLLHGTLALLLCAGGGMAGGMLA